MQVQILNFGAAKELIGQQVLEWEVKDNTSVGELKSRLIESFPKLAGLNSLLIAVNEEYADDEDLIPENADIAIIPPVSGG